MLKKLLSLATGSKQAHPLIISNNIYSRQVDKHRPLNEYNFVVVDTELTGLKEKKDEIVAIGAVRIKNLQIMCSETFYALTKPKKHLHTQSTLIHRITPQELTKADSLTDILPQFLDFCGNDIIVGHYIGLDLGFINRASLNLLGGIIKTPCLDTMRLAMAYAESKNGPYFDHYNSQSSYNLAALSEEYGLPKFPEHNALQDSLQTAYLFLFLIKKLQNSGAKTLLDYLKAGRKWKIIY